MTLNLPRSRLITHNNNNDDDNNKKKYSPTSFKTLTRMTSSIYVSGQTTYTHAEMKTVIYLFIFRQVFVTHRLTRMHAPPNKETNFAPEIKIKDEPMQA